MMRILVPCSSRCVAKLCLNVCMEMFFFKPDLRNARLHASFTEFRVKCPDLPVEGNR